MNENNSVVGLQKKNIIIIMLMYFVCCCCINSMFIVVIAITLRWSGRFERNFKENTENTVVDPIFTTYLLLNKITPNSDIDLMQKGVFCVKKGLIHGNTTFPTSQVS